MPSRPTEMAVLSAFLRFVATRVLVFVAFLATLTATYLGLALL